MIIQKEFWIILILHAQFFNPCVLIKLISNILIKEEKRTGICLSPSFEKELTLKNILKVLDMNNNYTNMLLIFNEEFIKNGDAIKSDWNKDAYVTKVAKLPMNETYYHDFIKNQYYCYLTVTNPIPVLSKLLSSHNVDQFFITFL